MNLTNNQPDIDKIYLYVKDPYESTYQFSSVLTILKLLLSIQMICVMFTKEYNAEKKYKILIVFDDMITDMINNKKLNLLVTDLFIRGRNLIISLVFITQ